MVNNHSAKANGMGNLSDLGKIEFIRSTKAHRMIIRINADGLRVSLPLNSTEADAIQFITKNKQKILKRQEAIQAKRTDFTISFDKEIQTHTFCIHFVAAKRETVFFQLKNDVLRIEIPHSVDIQSDNLQKTVWSGINYFLKKEAKRILPARVHFLANQHKFTISDVKIQSSRTRWGSCSNKQNINLSFYLMLLPSHLIDYVILHELCHTVEMNHSDRFWKLMDEVTDGKTDALRKEIKRYYMP